MQIDHFYFKQFLFMQGNLNNNNNVLMHIDVAGIVKLSLPATKLVDKTN